MMIYINLVIRMMISKRYWLYVIS